MIYKGEVEKIKGYVDYLMQKYGFNGPLHFTDFTNLKSIFDLGFLNSRGYCNDNNIKFTDVADREIIDHTTMDVKECVRFYYKERTPTLYRNEGIKLRCEDPHVPIPVYLLFDNELLYLDNTVYSDGNAKSRYTSFGDNYDFFSSMDWEWIFDRKPIYVEEGPEKWEIKRKRQAELLSLEPVPLKYIKNIIFRCNADEKRAINLFGYNKKYCVNSNMFHNLHNYIKDYKVNFRKNLSEIVFDVDFFGSNWEEYGFEYKVLDISNNVLKVFAKREYHVIDNSIPLRERLNYGKKIKFIFSNYSDEWNKINIYMNGILCIEENLENIKIIDNLINSSRISINNNTLSFEWTFQSDIFRGYKHSCKILDVDNNLLLNQIFDFPKEQESLTWVFKINGYNEKWDKFQYFINDKICVNEKIMK